MPLDDFLDRAIEGRQRIAQHRRPHRKRRPPAAGEPIRAGHAMAAGETVGQTLMTVAQQVDGEMPDTIQQRPPSGRAVDADQQGRRFILN